MSREKKAYILEHKELCKLDPIFCERGIENLTLIKEALHSPVLSSIGDALVNYAYMVARTRVIPGSSVSVKVWDYSLAEAFSQSKFKRLLKKKKKDKGSVGDSVEGLLAFVHFTGVLPLEEQIDILEKELREIHFRESLSEKVYEKTLASFAFKALIEVVEERLLMVLDGIDDEVKA